MIWPWDHMGLVLWSPVLLLLAGAFIFWWVGVVQRAADQIAANNKDQA